MKPNIKPIVRLGSALLLVLSTALTARAQYSNTIASQGAPIYYRLNETTQPAPQPLATNIGSLSSSANGTFVALPTLNAPGPLSGSVSVGVDGTSQYINTPYVGGLNTHAFSFELWANPAVIPTFGYLAASAHLASPRSGWYLAQDNGGTFGVGSSWVSRFFYQNGTAALLQLNAPVVPGWTHIVITFDGSSIAAMYTNGVLAMALTNAAYSAYVANVDSAFNVGIRSDGGFPWPGNVAEAAMYDHALTATRVAAHYSAANGAAYASAVGTDTPLLYDRYQAPTQVSAANSGALGSGYNGLWLADAHAASPGPSPSSSPAISGFESGNNAASFDAAGGAVRIPPLNFNTNTITICGWVNASNSQSAGAGIVVCDSGTTGAGLVIDGTYGGLGLGYYWNNDPSTFGFSPSHDLGMSPLPDSAWAFVALVIQPTNAVIYLASPTGPIAFQGFTNTYNHVNQSFAGPTLIGTDAGDPAYSLNGAVDEVSVFNRALSSGELYTEYASAVGGLAPVIFNDPDSPSQPIVAGNTFTISVNAGGTPNLYYYWRTNGIPIPPPEGTNAVYVKPNFDIVANVGNYQVVVSNSFGSVTSGVAVVTGQNATAPAIQTRPIGGTIYPGGTLNLSVGATGGGLVYQWKTNGVNIAGATSPTYVVATVTTNTFAGSYTVSVTNNLGMTNVGPAVIIVANPTTNSYAGVVAADAPEAWWRLDEATVTTGSVLEDAMGRHYGSYTNNGGLTGQNTGAISSYQSLNGKALKFNGDQSYAAVPYFSALSTPTFTLELWAKQDSVSSGVTAASSWDASVPAGFDIGTASYWEGNNVDYAVGQSAPLNSYDPTINPGQWVHIVLTHGGTGNSAYPWRIYINGYNDGTYIYGDDSALNASKPFIIGGRGTGIASVLSRYYIGYVDEVAFYTKVLTASQILNHYSAALLGVPPSFTVQPRSQNAFVGDNITLSVTTVGPPPITLLWKKNGVNLNGQTNSTITISNVYYTTSSDVYTCSATNSGGGLFSSNAVITVYAPPTYAYLTNGLVLHLPFDGSSLADTSGRNNNGTAHLIGSGAAAVSYDAGKLGAKSLTYQTLTVTNLSPTSSNVTWTGSSYVDLGSGSGHPGDLLFGASDSFSVSVWVKLPNGFVGGDLPFIGTASNSFNNPGWDLGPTYNAGGWQWCLNDGVMVQAVTNNIDVSGPNASINDGNWHNLVLTVNRATHTATSFLDGSAVGWTDITGLGSVNNGYPVTIGQDPTYMYPPSFAGKATSTDLAAWNGLQTATLDDIGVWRTALTDLQAKSIYDVGQNYGQSFSVRGPGVMHLFSPANGQLGIAWEAGTLQQATSLNGPWTNVPGATLPTYQFTPAPTGNMFYRVLQQ